MSRTASTVSLALVLCTLAGTTFGQNTYTGGSAVNGDWSRPMNWMGNAAPPVDGGNTRAITINTGAGGQTTSNVNQNLNNPFYTLLSMTFAVTSEATTITGVPLRFQGLNDNITDNTRDVFHIFGNQITLDPDAAPNGTRLLFIQGNASQTPVTGSQTGLIFNGRITQGANAAGLWIDMSGGADVIIANNSANPNNFSGPVGVVQGTLVIGCDSALGNGGALTMRGVNAAIRVRFAEERTLANQFIMGATTNIGAAGFDQGHLTLSGAASTGVNANQTRILNLYGARANGLGHYVTFGGDFIHAPDAQLEINGDVAPVMANGRVRNTRVSPKADNLGSLIEFNGNAAGFRGGVTAVRTTMRLNGTVASANARVMNNWTIGDGTAANAAVLSGRDVVAGPRGIAVNTARVFLNNGVTITTTKNSTLEPGASPGILAINGGSVTMEPGSNFAVTLNGTTPGNGYGFYGQLVLEEGAGMHLQYNGLGERPVLGIDLQTWDPVTGLPTFQPQLGDQFTIIDQVASWADTLYSPDSGGFGGSMFVAPDGTLLRQGAVFAHEELGFDQYFAINYYGGDGNDVVLTIVPTPGAAGALGLMGLAALRRRRR